MDRLKDKRYMAGAALLCMFLWGSAFPVLKLSYDTLNIPPDSYPPKILYAGFRFFLAGILVLLFAAVTGRKMPFKKRDLSLIIPVGLLQIFIQYIFFYIGVGNTTGIKSAIIQASSAFFTVLLAHFFLKGDRLNGRKIAALVIGFAGIIVANRSKGFGGGFSFHGEGFLLISTLTGSVASILVKKRGDTDPFVLTAGQMLTGSVLLILTGLVTIKEPIEWTAFGLGLLLYSGFLSAAAFVLWYRLVLLHPIGELSVYRLFIPIFGSILSALLIPGEGFTVDLIAGLVLVTAASSLIYLPGKTPAKRSE